MIDAVHMRAELASVLLNSALVRSPVMARLLRYLVETSISGDGKTLKSYSVAVDGLGRSPDFDPQTDAYARVQVARLRKLLDAFYAKVEPKPTYRLLIDSGSYEVRLAACHVARAARPFVRSSRFTLTGNHVAKWQLVAGIVASLIIAAGLVLFWRAESNAATAQWQINDFPFVDVTVSDETDGQSQTGLARRLRESILMKLDKYEGIRVAYASTSASNYSINVTLERAGDVVRENIMVIDRRSNRLIFSDSGQSQVTDGDIDLPGTEFTAKSLFHIVHPTGIIHSAERKRNHPLDTPYGCLLRFTAQIKNGLSLGDSDLAQCARNWHAAAPNHPFATGLYGWTLIDASLSQVTASGRQRSVQNAIDVLESGKALNPNSPFLQLAAMRAYAVAGNRMAMHAAAARALTLNPDNLDIQGVAGVTLTLWNDPEGEALLNRAIREHFNPPPWYFVGAFVSAMMREDNEGAGRAIAELTALQHSLAIRPILSAALEAHTGHLDQARASWNQAVAMQPILAIKPEAFFKRMPMAPEVRARLREWLAPVLK
ncbi:MAG: hypothetical protein ABJA20_04655 [Novosphingobium sp.]